MIDVTFSHFEEVTRGIKTLWFKPERPVRYIAGQFTELHLPHEPADDRGIRRWFTLSSSPTEELLAITTSFSTQRPSSFKQQLLTLQPGTTVTLADPMGDFVLPKDPTVPVVFVAAGLGITPVRSIVKWLLDTGERRDIRLLYGSHFSSQLAFRQLFAQYGLASTLLAKQLDGAPATVGVLSPDQILTLAQSNSNSLLYVSGPEQFVEATIKTLQTQGIAEHRLVGDYFPGYAL